MRRAAVTTRQVQQADSKNKQQASEPSQKQNEPFRFLSNKNQAWAGAGASQIMPSRNHRMRESPAHFTRNNRSHRIAS